MSAKTASVSSAAPLPVRARLDAPDFLRGLVMVLMALDHVRDFFTSARFDPLDLTQTTPALFFTRWVTHFCAPTFVLLAGAGGFLYGWRGRPRADTAQFLLSRGLWLVVLELTAVRFGWFFNFTYDLAAGQVIWAIGWAMVGLAGLSYWLPSRAVGIIGGLIIVGHNLLDPLTPAQFGPLAWLWQVLHEGGMLQAGGHRFMVLYPVLPWLGVMCAGYGLGEVLTLPAARRQRLLLTIGVSMIAAFVVVGLLNRYGDTTPWTIQSTPFQTVMSFLDTEKYPPALQYVLMTIGPALVMLALLERVPDSPLKRFFLTFGQVPLFYYVLHLLAIHALALVVAATSGFDIAFLFRSQPPGMGVPPGWGLGLPGVYLIWGSVVLALYPLCRWFAGVKQRNPAWWLKYL
jgi:uncharacterized membrane protein